jgi:hypothetical protein
MTNTTEDYYSIYDLISRTKYFLKYLISKWWVMLLACLLGATIGWAFYYLQKPKYQALTTFILEDKSAASGGSLAGLASQFGLSLGMSGSGSIFGGDNILDILKSKKIVEHVLLTNADSTRGNLTLADRYLDFSHIKKRWQNKPKLAQISFIRSNPLTAEQDSVLNLVYEDVVRNNLTTERASKQGTIIRVQITAPDAIFAKLMAERLVIEASKLYMNIRVGNLQANILELQSRSDSLLVLLNRKSFVAAASQPLDINPAIRTAAVPVEIANRDKTVLATLYAEVTKNLEASKMLLSQETPVIEMLDVPGLTLKDTRREKLSTCIAGAFGGLFLFILIFGAVYFSNSNKGDNLLER